MMRWGVYDPPYLCWMPGCVFGTCKRPDQHPLPSYYGAIASSAECPFNLTGACWSYISDDVFECTEKLQFGECGPPHVFGVSCVERPKTQGACCKSIDLGPTQCYMTLVERNCFWDDPTIDFYAKTFLPGFIDESALLDVAQRQQEIHNRIGTVY